MESEAKQLVEVARAAADAAGEGLALRAQALAVRVRDANEAEALALEGAEVAERAGLEALADRLLVTLAGIHLYSGRTEEAERVLSEVAARGHEPATSEALAQGGLLALERGDYSEAEHASTRAIDRLGSSSVWRAHAHMNRALARAYSGELDRAEIDLHEARRIYEALRCRLAVAESLQNLGWVMSLRGDYAGALEVFSAAEPILMAWSASRANLLRDRATTLLSVGLSDDAVTDAREAVDEFERNGLHAHRAECMRIVAMALEQGGRVAEAAEVARASRELFVAQARPIYADHAQLIALRAMDRTAATASDARAARSVARRLRGNRAHHVALEAQLTAARLAMWAGDLTGAEEDLREAYACRRSPRHDLKLAYWELAAELAAARGDEAGALRASRRGLAVLDESHRTLGSTEARVNVSAAAREIGSVALRLAERRGPATLFDWMERVRAGALRFRPVRPEGDDELMWMRASLRSLAREIEQGQLEGRDMTEAERQRGQAERTLRLRLLEARGDGGGAARPSTRDVRERLGGAVLIAYAGIEGRLVAVRLSATGSRRYELGPVSQVMEELDHLRFASLRLATGRLSPASLDVLRAGATRLDELLLRPVDRSDRPLVIVPMGNLFTVPWGLLPSAMGRPTTLAPSATMWMEAGGRSSESGRRVLAAGPDLSHAHSEVESLARIHDGAMVLEGSDASASRVLSAVDGAGLFHIACHGVFRSDNPLFSHLRVADGPLAVHELEGLGQAPATVVLSSCDVGLTQPRAGNEWLGMATALLSLGSRSLVASVMPVPDADATVALMRGMHERIARGEAVPEALHAAGADLPDDDLGALAARAAFVCIGA